MVSGESCACGNCRNRVVFDAAKCCVITVVNILIILHLQVILIFVYYVELLI